MAERPILFQGAMVRAILDGSKTQTRRICKPAQFYSMSRVVEVPDPQERGQVYNGSHFGDEDGEVQFASPYGGRGDRLWVRESHWWFKDEPDHETGYFPPKLTIEDVEYRADGDDGRKVWRPSIHMPRWACRLVLEVTAVRVERLQDISEADAIAEGIELIPGPEPYPMWRHYGKEHTRVTPASSSYQSLWEQINGPGSWAANPWVWVVEFRRVSP